MELRPTRGEALVALASMLLLGVGVTRVLTPGRERLRPLSVQGLDIASRAVGQGETVTNEATWSPPDDVYVVGWNPWVGAPESGGELALFAGDTRLLVLAPPRTPGLPSFPDGTGFLLRREQKLTLRYSLVNTGQPGQTKGAGALVYFVPATGN